MTDELEELAGAEMATDTAESVSGPEVDSDILPEEGDAEVAVGEEDVAEAGLESTEGSDSTDSTDLSQEEESKQPPSQGEMPFAIVDGKEMTTLPKDLYIPPDALEVILEAFEGPLDLLLYLIRRQNIDILDINVAEITKQYMQYVEMMNAMQFELAAEYLLMAAMLAEIKSRMLLPRSNEVEDEEEDPRANLIRRLQEYERFKKAAEDIDELPRMGRDIHQGSAQPPDRNLTRPEPEVDLKEVLLALSEVLRRADMFESHHVEKERLSTRERMGQVLDDLSHKQFVPFVSLFKVEEGRLGVVVTFLAVMELIKESLVEIIQSDAFGAIHVKARAQ
ncbi:segregation and condensation protein A [Pseudoteredinibacter isoporae]|uniref:segregation and condensation protein A n=1 Tax=Pseudoteredinibacter isoporae TaxID=570281 RepID=UPI0031054A84